MLLCALYLQVVKLNSCEVTLPGLIPFLGYAAAWYELWSGVDGQSITK